MCDKRSAGDKSRVWPTCEKKNQYRNVKPKVKKRKQKHRKICMFSQCTLCASSSLGLCVFRWHFTLASAKQKLRQKWFLSFQKLSRLIYDDDGLRSHRRKCKAYKWRWQITMNINRNLHMGANEWQTRGHWLPPRMMTRRKGAGCKAAIEMPRGLDQRWAGARWDRDRERRVERVTGPSGQSQVNVNALTR